MGAGTRQAAGGQKRRSRGRGAQRPNWLGGAAGWLWLLIVILPIYWMFTTALKTPSMAVAIPPEWIPTELTLANFARLFRAAVSLHADKLVAFLHGA